jgi:hypothetical protein
MIPSREATVEKEVMCITFKLGQPGPSDWTRLSHDEIFDTANSRESHLNSGTTTWWIKGRASSVMKKYNRRILGKSGSVIDDRQRSARDSGLR